LWGRSPFSIFGSCDAYPVGVNVRFLLPVEEYPARNQSK
jgi:hypothetical protein